MKCTLVCLLLASFATLRAQTAGAMTRKHVATRIRVVDLDGRPVKGARVHLVSGALPRVAPFFRLTNRSGVTDAAGLVEQKLEVGPLWCAWATYQKGRRRRASRMTEGMVVGGTHVLVLLPAGTSRLRVRGLAEWRDTLGDRLRVRVWVRGVLAPQFEARSRGDDLFALPPIPFAPFTVVVAEYDRPAAWVDLDVEERIAEMAQPVRLDLVGVRQDIAPGAAVHLECGRFRKAFSIDLTASSIRSIWLADRKAALRSCRLFVLDLEEPRFYRLKVVGTPREVALVRPYPLGPPLQTIVRNAPDKPIANATVWTRIGFVTVPMRTDSAGRILLWGLRPTLHVIENGRAQLVYPSSRKFKGANLVVDLSRRIPIEIVTTRPDGRIFPGVAFRFAQGFLGPSDARGRLSLKCMPGRFLVPTRLEESRARVGKPICVTPLKKGQRLHRYELPLWSMHEIVGHVRSVSGKGAENALVWVAGTPRGRPGARIERIAYVHTDAEGRFRLPVPDFVRIESIRATHRAGGKERKARRVFRSFYEEVELVLR